MSETRDEYEERATAVEAEIGKMLDVALDEGFDPDVTTANTISIIAEALRETVAEVEARGRVECEKELREERGSRSQAWAHLAQIAAMLGFERGAQPDFNPSDLPALTDYISATYRSSRSSTLAQTMERERCIAAVQELGREYEEDAAACRREGNEAGALAHDERAAGCAGAECRLAQGAPIYTFSIVLNSAIPRLRGMASVLDGESGGYPGVRREISRVLRIQAADLEKELLDGPSIGHYVGDVWRSPGGEEWEVGDVRLRVSLSGKSLTRPGWVGGISHDQGGWTLVRRRGE